AATCAASESTSSGFLPARASAAPIVPPIAPAPQITSSSIFLIPFAEPCKTLITLRNIPLLSELRTYQSLIPPTGRCKALQSIFSLDNRVAHPNRINGDFVNVAERHHRSKAARPFRAPDCSSRLGRRDRRRRAVLRRPVWRARRCSVPGKP